MKILSPLPALLASLLFAATAVAGEVAGYLFVTYRGEKGPQEEQIYFALSKDGREWKPLADGAPVLVSEVGEKGVRDPYLLRSHDGGKFYLLATDLSIHRNRDWKRAMRSGSRSLVIWESSDLVNWSAPRLATVAHELSGCAWAPEAVYDPEKKAYLVFWASTVSTEGFSKHRIWGSYTKDFTSFDYPFVFIEKNGTVIDATIVRDGDVYYRFVKDDGAKNIVMETAPKLGGPWSEMPGFSLASFTGYEGPLCYPLSPAADGAPATWCLLLANSAKGYQPFVTGNLADGRFVALEGVRFPFRFRHGSILPVTAAEYARLETAYARKPAAL